jgi:hypothetical protein
MWPGRESAGPHLWMKITDAAALQRFEYPERAYFRFSGRRVVRNRPLVPFRRICHGLDPECDDGE